MRLTDCATLEEWCKEVSDRHEKAHDRHVCTDLLTDDDFVDGVLCARCDFVMEAPARLLSQEVLESRARSNGHTPRVNP